MRIAAIDIGTNSIHMIVVQVRPDLSFEVIDHAAAVRPIINESKALIGVHPADEHLAFFNGLGSKGALHAPFFAGSLAAHLADGAPLDEACDLRRNL